MLNSSKFPHREQFRAARPPLCHDNSSPRRANFVKFLAPMSIHPSRVEVRRSAVWVASCLRDLGNSPSAVDSTPLTNLRVSLRGLIRDWSD